MKIAGQVTTHEEADLIESIVRISVIGIRMRQLASNIDGEDVEIDEEMLKRLL